MTARIALLGLLVSGAAASAEEILREFRWEDVEQARAAEQVTLLRPDAENRFHQLKVTGRSQGKTAVSILTVENPGIASANYAIRGRVRYEGVEYAAYLEMWSYFPNGGMHFSRTLDQSSGPLQDMTGESGWREFVLPFYIRGTEQRPTRLSISVVLPGRGTVWLGPMQLVQFAEEDLAPSDQWWTERTGRIICGVGGLIVGVIGGVVGLLGSRGRGRRFVLAMMKTLSVLGIAILAAGVVALILRQPYMVYCPLLIGGGLCAVLFEALLPLVRKRFQQWELRRMQGMDAS